MTEKTNAELVDEVEVIACMIEDRVFRALDMNDGNTLRVFAARLAAAEAENGRMREVLTWLDTLLDQMPRLMLPHDGRRHQQIKQALAPATEKGAG